jgi:large subunit ribosomal protein L20
MSRVKRGVGNTKKKHNLRVATRGFYGRRKNLLRTQMEAYRKSLMNSYIDRKRKKREFRQLWIIRINSVCRKYGIKYSEFIHRLRANNINIDRKVLASMAVNDEKSFESLVKACNTTGS